MNELNRALEIGKTGEYLVIADLIINGYRAFPTDQGLPYDLVLDHKNKLYRIQVKTSFSPRPIPNRSGSSNSYLFSVRRAGNGAKRIIKGNEFDILVLVALDIKCIAYFFMGENILQTIHLRKPNSVSHHKNKMYKNIDEYSINDLLMEREQEYIEDIKKRFEIKGVSKFLK